MAKLDSTDRRIISLMLEEAKTSYADIGQALSISGGTVHVRLKKLADIGVINGSSLKVNFAKLGFQITAFVGVNLERSDAYDNVVSQFQKIPEIVSAHYTTGSYGIFLKLMCRGTDHLRETLSQIQMINGIQSTETFLSLDELINRVPNVLEME